MQPIVDLCRQVALVVLMFPGVAQASSEFGPDLSVGLLIEPAGVIAPDTTGVLYVTATNHGAGSVEPAMMFSKRTDVTDYFLDFYPDAETAPCTYAFYVGDELPGNPSYRGIVLWPGVALEPGASVTCRLKFRVGPEASGIVQVNAGVLPNSQVGIDPDYSNNTIDTSIIVRPAAPAPLHEPVAIPSGGAFAALVLILVMATVGAGRLHRRRLRA